MSEYVAQLSWSLGEGELAYGKYSPNHQMTFSGGLSAIMTSAGDVLDGANTNPLVIFRQGAGHVKPNSAANPGVVFDSSWNDWLAFICATQPQGLESTCNALWGLGYSKDPSDFNSPSIAIGALAGTQTVTRRVTNVSGNPLTLNASVTAAGFTATVSPSPLTLAAGETKSFTVAFTRTSAALNAYTGGQLTWTGGGYTVRSPIVVRPVASVTVPMNSVSTSNTSSSASSPSSSVRPDIREKAATAGIVRPMVAMAEPSARLRLV